MTAAPLSPADDQRKADAVVAIHAAALMSAKDFEDADLHTAMLAILTEALGVALMIVSAGAPDRAEAFHGQVDVARERIVAMLPDFERLMKALKEGMH